MDRSELNKKYLDAADRFRLIEAKEDRILLYLSGLRLLTFAGSAALFLSGFLLDKNFLIILAVLVLIMFLLMLKYYTRHSDIKEFTASLVLINTREAEAVSGNISAFDPGNRYIEMSHDFSFDVDLFGDSSVFQYLNRTVTDYGKNILAKWLSDPYRLSSEINTRQEIIRELSGKAEWRQNFMASGMKVPLKDDEIDGFLKWLLEDPLFVSSRLKKFLIFFLPSVTLIVLLFVVSGILDYSIFIFIFLLNLLYISAGLKKTNSIHRVLSGKYNWLTTMNSLLKMFEGEVFRSEYLNNMKQEISGADNSATVSVRKLSRLIQSFDSRLNMLVGLALNGLLLWDYHCIYRLEKWKNLYRIQFPFWLEILGKVDAFISLGNYAFNNPEFTYPAISGSDTVFGAEMLGHPLIAAGKRVCNDFSIDRTGTICIISGANMSGKSTFLRTLTVNYILGMAGAPVCAEKMTFKPMKLFTSMRTTDSLSGNESYFYAELKRLKNLKTRVLENDPVIFILDEILKGTNSADKTLGSNLFIRKLMSHEATGLIATHDISLGELEKEYPEKIINMCFEIEIEGEMIIFDYKLRKGITRKMNAALLMKQMGILD